MTSWAFVAVCLALGGLTGWWITRTFILGPPPPPPPGAWESLTKEQRTAWLRHPAHRTRCQCAAYGLPGADMVLDDSTGEPWKHTATSCQPTREAL